MRLRYEKTVLEIPQNAASVLDIGCGAGHFCIALAKKGVSNILGIDYSENMIQLAKKHAMDNKIDSGLTFEVQDFINLKVSTKYDYSIIMGFIEYFENPESILEKAIALTNKKIFVSFPENQGILALQRKIRYKNKCFLKLYNREDIVKLMDLTGIKKYTIDKISRDYFVTINV
jgi:2-polyprenyl-3-methyl-5-hydroxy-6-metoxy-1,4-benzoquinol methylase